MCNMSYTQKIDVLDMIIKVLQDHEKTLDQLITRLEENISSLASKA